MKKQYGKRDVTMLGELYLKHVDAMTAEGLHSKSDIAAELAWRDARIEELEAELKIARYSVGDMRAALKAERDLND